MRALVALAVVLATGAANADPPYAALRDVLGEAAVIVRGTGADSTSRGGFTDTRVVVLETVRGDAAGEITVRQPTSGEEPIARGEDVILLLDARAADGVYPLHHPAGRYRVESSERGDVVIVNASGVDGATISAKDLRPRAPDERIAIDQFRTLAGAAQPRPAAAPPTPPLSVPSRASSPSPASPPPAPPAPPAESADTSSRWPWLVGFIALAAVLVYVLRRIWSAKVS